MVADNPKVKIPPPPERWVNERGGDISPPGDRAADGPTPSTIEVVHGILNQAIDEVGDRATLYDKPQGEESMPTVVKMFNTLYNTELTVEQGWMFMTILKQVRSSNGRFKMDNYVDLAAYSAFAGKAAQDEA